MNPSSPALPPLQAEPPAQSTRVVRFGVFEVDLQTAELRKQGVRIRLCGAFEMHRCFTGRESTSERREFQEAYSCGPRLRYRGSRSRWTVGLHKWLTN
jgi:hypothetical protein